MIQQNIINKVNKITYQLTNYQFPLYLKLFNYVKCS